MRSVNGSGNAQDVTRFAWCGNFTSHVARHLYHSLNHVGVTWRIKLVVMVIAEPDGNVSAALYSRANHRKEISTIAQRRPMTAERRWEEINQGLQPAHGARVAAQKPTFE